MAIELSPRIQARIDRILRAHSEIPDADSLLDSALDQFEDANEDIVITPQMREQIAIGTAQIERGETVRYDDAFRERSKREALRRYHEIMNSNQHDQP